MKKIAVLGIIMLISVSVLFRGLYYTYDTVGFMAAIALLLILYFFGKISGRETLQINKLYLLLGCLMIAATLLSFTKAVNLRENLGNILIYAELLVIFIVFCDYFHDKKQQFIQTIMLPTVFVGFIAAVVGLMELTGKFHIWEVYSYNGRLGTTYQYSNTAAIYFIVCTVFAFTLFNTLKNPFLRASMVGIGNILLFAFFMTGSRGGYLTALLIFSLLLIIQSKGSRIPGGVGFICMLVPFFIVMRSFNVSTANHDNLNAAIWLLISFLIATTSWLLLHLLIRLIVKDGQVTAPKGSGFVFAAVAVVTAVLLVMFKDRLIGLIPRLIVERVERLFTYGFNEINVFYRLEFDRDALLLIRDHWLFGLGGGGWKAMYQTVQDHFYTAVFVHNHYLQVFVDNGILAFLSFAALVILSIAGALFSFIRGKGRQNRTYSAGLLCGLLALAGHSAIDFNLSYTSLLMLIWIMFAASAVCLHVEDGGIAGMRRRGLPFISRWNTEISGGIVHMALLIVSAVLISINGMFFAGAYNRQVAFDYVQQKDYRQARIYYEEACRLDSTNPDYAYELAKIYRYYANAAKNEENRKAWLDKALTASEKSVDGNRNYAPYMRVLVRIYLDMDMPLEALELSQKLITCQKYNAECYELLAASYLAAAGYYEENGNDNMAKELLTECLKIDNDPYLHRSGILSPLDHDSQEIINQYEHSDVLAELLKEAAEKIVEKY
jgi:O-antigen ligase